MEKIGIVKELDKLGRIVIPKDLRDRYGINDKVEIVATRNGVLIKSIDYVLTRKSEERK